MSKCYVFAYGTLLDPKIRLDLLGYSTTIIKTYIKGFRKDIIILEGIKYPILIEDIGSIEIIEGGYFQIKANDLKKLDAYESTTYRRKLALTADNTQVWIYYR